MSQDNHRPCFHFLPPSGWMNDPNGLIQRDGTYHLYYQHNPKRAQSEHICWGHAVSRDLLHWQHRPIAMQPTAGSADADGCWSGCAVAAGEQTAFLYTGVVKEPDGDWKQSACLAWSSGDLDVLHKDPANPVIPLPPPAIARTGFRDHSVWMQPDGWRMAIGSGHAGRGGEALLYASTDLRRWEPLGALCSAADLPPADFVLGNMWECPSFFFDNDQAALIISGCGEGGYGATVMTGRYQDPRFYPKRVEKLDWGERIFYAPQVFRDEGGRLLIFGWLMEERSAEDQLAAGWSGVMSLPRELQIDSQGVLRQQFIPALKGLRGRTVELRNPALTHHGERWDIDWTRLELEMEIPPAGRCVVDFLNDPQGDPVIRLNVGGDMNELVLQRAGNLPELAMPLPRAHSAIKLHAFLDGSTFECLVNGTRSLTARFYPPASANRCVRLIGVEHSPHPQRVNLYEIRSTW